MRQILALWIALIPVEGLGCSIIGGFPSLDNLDETVVKKDSIFRGIVLLKGEETRIEVLERFKGPFEIGDVISYEPWTNCEEFYTTHNEERIFFGWMYREKIQFSLGDGSVSSNDQRYPEILAILRIKYAGET